MYMEDKIDPTIYDKDIWLNELIDEINNMDSYPSSDYEYTDLINREEVIGLLKSKLNKQYERNN